MARGFHIDPAVRGRLLLPSAGFLATAVAFGPARMGFGLFLPTFREAFAFDTQLAGLVASGAFGAFLISLPLAGWLTNRQGPRAPVLLGGLLAAAGMALVAMAQTLPTLAAGIMIAASSAGLCWTPYNNAAERIVERERRSRTLSIISTGTTLGMAGAGALALVVALRDIDWRVAWAVFAGLALLTTLTNWQALKPVAGDPGSGPGRHQAWQSLWSVKARPLALAALSFGTTSALYLAFAVDRASSAGALTIGSLESAAPLLFVALGLIGLVGLATGEMENRIGLVALVRATFLASTASMGLIALWPAEGWAVVASAGLQGAVIMVMSATFSFWSARLFPSLPSVSFTVVLLFVAGGSVVGPWLAGTLAGAIGMKAVFLAGAGLSAATAFAVNARLVAAASSRDWRRGTRSRVIAPPPE